MTDEEKAAEEAAAAAGDGDNQPDAKALADENAKLKSDLEEKTKELEGLKNKDNNFGNLRKQTEDQQQKHEEEKSALSKQVDDLQAQITANETNQQSDWYASLVHLAVGGDEEKKASVKAEYDLLNMPTKTREDVLARSKKALKLAGFEVKGDVSSLSFGGGKDSAKPEKSYSDTDEGQRTKDFLAPDLAEARRQQETNKS